MSYTEFTVKYENTELADDTVVSIPDIGEVKNGGTFKVTAEQQEAYENATGHKLRDSIKANAALSIQGQTDKKEGGDK